MHETDDTDQTTGDNLNLDFYNLVKGGVNVDMMKNQYS